MAALAATQATAQQPPLLLWYDTPARHFEEALPIGNGKMGALIYGGTDSNTIFLNDITLWTGKPVDRNEDAGASRWIPEIRKALFNEDYRAADSLQLNVQGHNSEYYQPLGTLTITDNNSGPATEYRRELCLDSALCKDSYTRNATTFSREYFASHPDRLIAVRLRASKPGAINCSVSLSSLVPHTVKAFDGGQLTMTGHALGDPNNSIHFCTILRATAKGGTTHATDSTITISGATEATVYIVNATSFNGFDKHPVSQGAPYLENAADDAWHTVNLTYDEMKRRHVADFSSLFGRFRLTLAGATADDSRTTEQQLKDYTAKNESNPYLETLYAQYGRYLLISCSRTPGVPANLQGLWANKLRSPWRGNYTVNINLEENYWPAEVANLPEMAMPLEGFISALAANGRHTARNYYGVERGWCSSHNSDIWAMTNPVGEKREKPEWANWNMGGAWLVNALYEHFRFGRDTTYLCQTAYPLMKGAAEFCLGWLTDNPLKPGELITAPSTSPENEYVTDKGYHGMTCYGGTADTSNPFRRKVVQALVLAMFYDLNAIIHHIETRGISKRPRADIIFTEFIRLVEGNFKSERRVSWYAEQMCITPKYLAETVKQVSRRTPNEWIDNYVTLELRLRLKNSSKSIKEIATDMHFPNQSFLGKYFKEHVGLSPSSYRKEQSRHRRN